MSKHEHRLAKCATCQKPIDASAPVCFACGYVNFWKLLWLVFRISIALMIMSVLVSALMYVGLIVVVALLTGGVWMLDPYFG